MKFEVVKEFGLGVEVHQGDFLFCIPATHASRMHMDSGSFDLVEALRHEKGVWIARNNTGGFAVVFEHEPLVEDSGKLSMQGRIRSFCWDKFAEVTGVALKAGQYAKYKLVPTASKEP